MKSGLSSSSSSNSNEVKVKFGGFSEKNGISYSKSLSEIKNRIKWIYKKDEILKKSYKLEMVVVVLLET